MKVTKSTNKKVVTVGKSKNFREHVKDKFSKLAVKTRAIFKKHFPEHFWPKPQENKKGPKI